MNIFSFAYYNGIKFVGILYVSYIQIYFGEGGTEDEQQESDAFLGSIPVKNTLFQNIFT